jgi:hypothetical protein
MVKRWHAITFNGSFLQQKRQEPPDQGRREGTVRGEGGGGTAPANKTGGMDIEGADAFFFMESTGQQTLFLCVLFITKKASLRAQTSNDVYPLNDIYPFHTTRQIPLTGRYRR